MWYKITDFMECYCYLSNILALKANKLIYMCIPCPAKPEGLIAFAFSLQSSACISQIYLSCHGFHLF